MKRILSINDFFQDTFGTSYIWPFQGGGVDRLVDTHLRMRLVCKSVFGLVVPLLSNKRTEGINVQLQKGSEKY